MGVVYVTTCRTTGKQYVGKSIHSLAARKAKHEKDAPSSPFPLHRAMMKYGFDDFEWVVTLEHEDEPTLLDCEMIMIQVMKTQIPNGYNVTAGGDGFRGHVKTAEHRRKIGEAFRGRKLSDEHKKKLSESMKGKPGWNKGVPMSEESKKKLSESHTGKVMTEACKEHLSRYWKGRVSPMKGRTMSEESRLKISTALKGRKKKSFTEQHKLNIKLASMKRYGKI